MIGRNHLRKLLLVGAWTFLCHAAIAVAGSVPVMPAPRHALPDTAIAPKSPLPPVIVPSPVIDFGEVGLGDRADTAVTVTIGQAASGVLHEWIISPTGEFTFSSAAQFPVTLKPGVLRVDSIVYRPRDVGSDTAYLIVQVDAALDTITLLGNGARARIDFEADGTQIKVLDFGTIRSDLQTTLTIDIVNRGKTRLANPRPFIVGGDGLFYLADYSWRDGPAGPLEPGDSVHASLVFRPNGSTGPATAFLRLAGDSAAYALELRGNARAKVTVRFSPDTLAFPPSDTCRLDSIELHNDGNRSVRIDSLTIGSGPFTVVDPPAPFTIDSAATRKVYLRFCPNDLLPHEALVTFYGNADNLVNGYRYKVSGSGTGVSWTIDSTGGAISRQPRFVEIPDTARDTLWLVLRSTSAAMLYFGDTGLLSGSAGFHILPHAPMIEPGARAELRIEFAPAGRLDTLRDTLVIALSRGAHLAIPLAGRGVAARLVLNGGAPVTFPKTVVGASRRLRVPIANVGNIPLLLSSSGITLAFAAGHGPLFEASLDPILPGSLTLAPGASDSLIVSFMPRSAELDTAVLRLQGTELWKGIPLRAVAREIRIFGEGLRGGGGTIGFDRTYSASTGDTVELRLRSTAPFITEDHVMGIDAQIVLQRYGLYPIDAFSPGGPVTVTRTTDGRTTTLRIQGTWLTPLTGDLLVRFRLMPLSTAKPTELVQVAHLMVGDSVFDGIQSGTVAVAGCAVGSLGSFGVAGKLSGIAVDAGVATVTYTAAAGSIPEVRVIDLQGDERLRTHLPDGTGEEQRAELPLPGLAGGIYLLELRIGDDRSTMPILLLR
jgi:hypothetical protein